MSLSLSAVGVGIVLAAAGAIAWAAHYLFIRVGVDGGKVMDAAMVALLTNVVLLVPLGLIRNYPDFGITPVSAAAFAIAGLGSGLFGRLCQYKSTELVGASRTSPIVASAGLVSTLLAVVVLAETLTLPHLVGILLIVVGVVLTSRETTRDSDPDDSSAGVGTSMLLPFGAAFFYGIEPIWVKVGLAEGTPFLVGMSIMILTAAVGFVGYRTRYTSASLATVLREANLKWYLGAGIAGAFAFLAYFAALASAPVVVVMPIFQTVPLLVVGLSLLFLPRRLERVTWRLAGGAALVVAGAILVSLSA